MLARTRLRRNYAVHERWGRKVQLLRDPGQLLVVQRAMQLPSSLVQFSDTYRLCAPYKYSRRCVDAVMPGDSPQTVLRHRAAGLVPEHVVLFDKHFRLIQQPIKCLPYRVRENARRHPSFRRR